jgi:hypothetical protein
MYSAQVGKCSLDSYEEFVGLDITDDNQLCRNWVLEKFMNTIMVFEKHKEIFPFQDATLPCFCFLLSFFLSPKFPNNTSPKTYSLFRNETIHSI